MSKERHFWIRTYLNEMQLKMVIMAHNVRCYAYILHDCDVDDTGKLVEPHYHIILSLYNGTTLSSVSRWFKGFVDSKGMLINSHCEVAVDKYYCFDYLTHETPKCIEKGAYIYSKSLIVSNNIGFYMANRESQFDTTTLCLLDLINGVSYEQMVYRYGKHFILNHQKFIDMACLMLRNDCFKPNNYGLSNGEYYGHDCDLVKIEKGG